PAARTWIQRRSDPREQTAPELTAATGFRSAVGLRAALFFFAPRRDPEASHFSIEIAALDAEHVGRPRDVALKRRERAEDVFAFPRVARLVQRTAFKRRRQRRGRARREVGPAAEIKE